jgi:hypothetical protein
VKQKILDLLAKYLARVIAWFTAPTEAWLKRAIKGAAVCLTTPATVIEAGKLYTDPILKATTQASALTLVEGALLLGWHKLDDRSEPSTPAQRWLYAALAITAYLVLWAVAIVHGEGIIGIAFRLTLGVLLGYSINESGILAGIRLQRSADRDINRHRKVRRHRERAEIRVAIARLDADEDEAMKQINPSYTRKPTGIAALFHALTGQPLATSVKVLEAPNSLPNVDVALTDVDRQLLALYGNAPKLPTRDAGKQIGKSHTWVGKRLAELEAGRVIHRNGKGVEILQPELLEVE